MPSMPPLIDLALEQTPRAVSVMPQLMIVITTYSNAPILMPSNSTLWWWSIRTPMASTIELGAFWWPKNANILLNSPLGLVRLLFIHGWRIIVCWIEALRIILSFPWVILFGLSEFYWDISFINILARLDLFPLNCGLAKKFKLF